MNNYSIRITEFVVFCLPFIEELVLIAGVAGLVVWLFRTKVAPRWLRICMRAAGAVLALPLLLGLLLLFGSLAGATRPRLIVAPDAQRVAEHYYDSGWMGRDLTFVSVRRKWSIRHDVVYRFIGPSDWTSTQVFWLDNHRLMIRYDQNEIGNREECKTEGAGIDVLCETTPH